MAGWYIVGYTFQAEILCGTCAVQKFLTVEIDPGSTVSSDTVERFFDILALWRGIDRYEEESFDSSEFPKVVLSCTEHDEKCHNCNEELR
ncbi:hypothetical protein SEA_LABELLE_57 [Mycobacterium phage Labelle]|nr:hypothetical protein SEA_LABELLE_57 [Mycobacterium phage Labelle]